MTSAVLPGPDAGPRDATANDLWSAEQVSAPLTARSTVTPIVMMTPAASAACPAAAAVEGIAAAAPLPDRIPDRRPDRRPGLARER